MSFIVFIPDGKILNDRQLALHSLFSPLSLSLAPYPLFQQPLPSLSFPPSHTTAYSNYSKTWRILSLSIRVLLSFISHHSLHIPGSFRSLAWHQKHSPTVFFFRGAYVFLLKTLLYVFIKDLSFKSLLQELSRFIC